MKLLSAYIFILLCLLSSSICFGQTDSTKTVRVETIDGNVFIGYIASEDSINLVVKTDVMGEVKIPLDKIKSQTQINGLKKVGRQYWLANPQSSRYFWAPNGYGLEKGSSYYQNIWVLYNQVSTGLTDNFSVGAGMIPLFLFGSSAIPVWIVPKFSIPVVKEKLNIGTGAFIGTILGVNSGVFGLVYGTVTVGSRDKNMSLGVASGFVDGKWLKVPIINPNFIVRVSPRGYLISENYIITAGGETVVVLSFGGRSLIRNISLDYSLWMPVGVGNDRILAIPFLGITIPMGNKKSR
jgi:hypothetical protein